MNKFAKLARLPKGLVPKSTNLPQLAIILIQAFMHGLNGKKKKKRSSMPRFDKASATLGNFSCNPSRNFVATQAAGMSLLYASTENLLFFFAALRDTLSKVELISTSRNCNSGGNKNVAPYFCGWVRYTGQFIMLLISQQNCKTCCTKNCL